MIPQTATEEGVEEAGVNKYIIETYVRTLE
jgi:hypothetical protein